MKVSIGRMRTRKNPSANRLLQRYDKALEVKWIPEHLDENGKVIEGSGRWGVYTKDSKGNAYRIYIAKRGEEDDIGLAGYRDIDKRDLDNIIESDQQRAENAGRLATRLENNDQDLEDKGIEQFRSDMDAISRERWRSVVGNPVVPANAPWLR